MRNEKSKGGSLPLAPTSLVATPSAMDGSGIAFAETRSKPASQVLPLMGRSLPRNAPFFTSLGISLFLFSLFLFSCVSMQDDVYSDTLAGSAEVSDFERRFSVLDAQFFASGELSADKKFLSDCTVLISDIDSALSAVNIKNASLSRLYAIEGCVYLALKETTQAKKCHERSVSAFKGDARALILAHRLGIEKNFTEKMASFSEKSLLILEEALTHFSNAEYAEAVADFDEAFLSLDGFYLDSYESLRNTSWNLRNSSGTDSELLALKNITVMQMLLIAQLHPDVLFNYTLGKNLSNKELYVKIAGSGLLNPVSKPLDAENAVSKETIVTKLIATRFLWNVYNQRKNTPQNRTKYSVAYENKKRSPILDVRLDSPDFDAALGCVENEIMHLEDGIELGAEKEISGVEFNESVGRIK